MKVLVTSASCGSHCGNNVEPQNNYTTDFICLDSENYSTRNKSMRPRLVGKIPKMLAWHLYPGYDYYMWIDQLFNLNNPDAVSWFINELGDHDALFFAHPHRSSIYSEYDFCKTAMNDNNQYIIERYQDEDMDLQIKDYNLNQDYIDDLLIAAGAFIYKASLVENKNYNVMKEWFFHNCIYSVQDQISLPFLLKRLNINYKLINSNIYSFEYLK
jgi:hypothetical protein